VVNAEPRLARREYQRSRGYSSSVLTTWHGLFQKQLLISLKASVDQAKLFRPLFEYADHLAAEDKPASSPEEVIRSSLAAMGTPIVGVTAN
jgi:hypothetical protein